MFDRFTDRARRVVVLAQDEARNYPDDLVRTIHFVLAMISEGEGVAYQVLNELGVTHGDALEKAHVIMQPLRKWRADWPASIFFHAEAKKMCELALREAMHLEHNYIGTEHLLLGLTRMDGSGGMDVLVKLGHSPADVRDAVAAKLQGYAEPNPYSRLRPGRPGRATLSYPKEPSASEVLATARAVAERIGALDAYIEKRAREIAAEALSRADAAEAELARIKAGGSDA